MGEVFSQVSKAHIIAGCYRAGERKVGEGVYKITLNRSGVSRIIELHKIDDLGAIVSCPDTQKGPVHSRKQFRIDGDAVGPSLFVGQSEAA